MAKTLNKKSASNRKPRGADGKAVDPDAKEKSSSLGHNARDRRIFIRAKHAELNGIEAKVEELRAKISGLNKQKNNIFREMKSDLDISREDFEAMRRVATLNKNEREHTITNFQEVYEALRPGEQLSFLSDAPTPKLDATGEKAIEDEGFAAGKAGKSQNTCPYIDEPRAKIWERGRIRAQTELAMAMGGGAAGQA